MEYTVDAIEHEKGLLINIKENFFIYMFKEVPAVIGQFMALHGAGCKAHMNFADELICLWSITFRLK
jgi:hypothetical protein